MSDHVHDPSTPPEESSRPEVSSRRGLLGKGAIAAAVAAAAGLAHASRADAVDGDTFIIGAEGQSAQSPTELKASVSFSGSVLYVNDRTGYTATDAAYPGALAAFSDTRHGVYGYTNGEGKVAIAGLAPYGTGVYGEHASSSLAGDGVGGYSSGGFGVRGTGSNGGVYGENVAASQPGPGVVGRSTAGTGVIGRGTTADFEATGNGMVVLTAPGVAAVPAGGTVGSIARDAAGNLWFCHTNGQWRKLAGPAAAGAFHAISPVRVYDSRAAAPTPGVLAPNASRVVSIKDGRNAAGAVTAADVVPAGATAVTFNVTVTGATGPNYLSVVPGNAAGFTTSTLNWAGGADVANGGVVKLDANRQIKLFMGDQTGSSHVIVDITGYYL